MTRKDIRDAFKNMLIGNTTAGQNVYSNRTATYFRQELPSISIFTTEETANPRDTRNLQYHRTLNVRLEIHAEANENLDDILDGISSEIEQIIFTDLSIQGTTLGTVYRDSSIELAEDATIKTIGVLTMNFESKYIK